MATIAAIAADNRSGATALTRRVAGALTTAAADGDLLAAGRAAVQAQPAMASILNLASAALAAAERGAVAAEVSAFLAQLDAAGERIAERAAELVPTGGRVLTLSASSAVRAAILAAARAGRAPRVLCLESRPLCEGRALALELAERGIAVTLAADAAAARLAGAADLVLVGGDAVTPAGLVNKLGTTALALAGGWRGRPIFALAGSQKFAAALARGALDRGGPPEELAGAAAERLTVLNPYFELTPLGQLSGIVTETDVLDAARAAALAAERTPHPALADLCGPPS
jgi:translation initiation factor eIF-2B subunit delta